MQVPPDDLAFKLGGRPVPENPIVPDAEELCAAMARDLAVPWLALRSADGEIDVQWGRLTSTPMSVNLELDGAEVGTLQLSPRPEAGRFTAHEVRLMASLSPQIAVAVQALVLVAQLQHVRQRLVASRGAERKRLRDDLHDDLGSALVGLRMQLHALRARTARCMPEPDREYASVARTLDQVDAHLERCVAEVSKLVESGGPGETTSST